LSSSFRINLNYIIFFQFPLLQSIPYNVLTSPYFVAAVRRCSLACLWGRGAPTSSNFRWESPERRPSDPICALGRSLSSL